MRSAMSNLTPELIYHRNLPHIQPPGGTFFVTFRLAGSMPADVLAMLHAEAERTHAELERLPASPERAERLYLEERRFFGKWDAVLDQGKGPNWLRNTGELAELIADAMHFFDGKRYDLFAYCIMSNHVHVVFTPLLKGCGRVLPVRADHAHDERLYSRTGQSASEPFRRVLAAREL